MLDKHKKYKPGRWLAGAVLTAGLVMLLPAAKPVYADPSAGGFSGTSASTLNNVSVKQWGYYHIAFQANGGSGSMNPITLVTDQSEQLPQNIFTRPGYKWTGWKGSDGNSYTDGQSVKNLTDVNDATITLTAQWEALNQTAKFDLNYDKNSVSVPTFASGSSDTVVKKTDEKFGKLPELNHRNGYNFDGWYTAPEGGQKIDVNNTIPVGGATYYAHWDVVHYRIHYGMDHGLQGASWPTSYTIEDSFTVDTPHGKDASHQLGIDVVNKQPYYFTGWTGPGVSGYPNTITVKKGTTGNKLYGSTWSPDGYRVTCHDWSVDAEGNPYNSLGSNEYTFAVPGTKVSGSQFGTNPALNFYYRFYLYHDSQTVTVGNGNTSVNRYFWRNQEDVRSRTYDGAWIPTDFTVTINYHRKNGSLISSTTQDVKNSARFGLSHPDGMTWSVSNVKTPAGHSPIEIHNNNSNGFISMVWSGGEDGPFPIINNVIIRQWNGSSFVWNAYTPSDPHAAAALESEVYTVDGKDYSYLDLSKQRYRKNASLKMKSVKTKPGFTYQHLTRPYYLEGGYGTQQTWVNLWDQSFTVDAPTSVDDNCVLQDAYGIIFDANGGEGDMKNQLIQNTDSDADRHINKSAFRNPYADFLGWSTNPDATDESQVEYKDGAVIPKNAAKPCEYLHLYAVWKWHDDDADSAAGAKKQTTFDWNEAE